MRLKTCKICKIEKQEEDFYRNKRHPDGRLARCKLCYTAALDHPEARKRRLTAKARRRTLPHVREATRNADYVWRQKNPEAQLVRHSKQRARAKGILHTLVAADIQIPTYCPLLGTLLARSNGAPTWSSPSLDRLDPSAGYTPENVLVISRRANTMKSNATLEELELLVTNLIRIIGAQSGS